MELTRKVYLIDFENTREYGIKALEATEKDLVVIVYTANAAKLDLDSLNDLHASLRVVRAQTGKQSLDLLLVSQLGFLMSENGKNTGYVIVSNDADYDGVVAYWSSRGYQVERRTVNPAQVKKDSAPQSSQPQQAQSQGAQNQGGQNQSGQNQSGQNQNAQSKAPADLGNRLQAALDRDKVDPAVKSFIRQKVTDLYGDRQRKSVIYRAIIGKYGQKNGLRYYNLIKKEL